MIHDRIAEAVSSLVEHHERSFSDRWPLEGVPVIEAVADVFAYNVPDFDRAGFVRACGLPQ